MNRTILAPPVMAGALEELRQWLAVSRDSENPQLESLLRASLGACEAFTGIVPITLEAEIILPVLKEWQGIPAQPVQAVLGIQDIPAEGPRFALPADAWAVELGADGTACIRVTRAASAGRVAVRFIAGLSPDWASLPDGLRHGILSLAAHYYRAREGEPGPSPPAAVAALWRPWRVMWLT